MLHGGDSVGEFPIEVGPGTRIIVERGPEERCQAGRRDRPAGDRARYVWRPDQARPAEVDLPRPDRVISGLLDGAIRRDGGVARDEQRRQQTAWDHPVTIQT